MKKYSKYPSYKDSGVEWLGNIPSEWYAKKLKFISTVNDEVLSDSTPDNEEINYIDIGSVTTGYIQNYEKMIYANAPSRARRIIKNGDILVSTVRTYLKAIAPVPDEYDSYIASTGFAVIRSKTKLNSQFTKYALLSNYFVDLVESRSVGVSYPAINATDIMTFKISLPPLSEQQSIANYLDKATAKIDTLIEKQTKLIELLREKRQAVISTAVTRGLDNTVAMKDSGVEWLGEIPEHWEVKQGKFIGKILSTPNVSDDSLDEISPVLYIKVDDLNYMHSKYLNSAKHRVSRNSGYVKAISGFISFPKRGAAIFTNKACIVTVMSMIDPNLMAWQIFNKYNKEYILSLLLTRGLSEIADVSTVPQINNKHIEPLKFPIPPVREQEEIVNYIDEKTSNIDTLITKATKAIDLLKEKRTTLISAAVTGKIDVREIV